jgi:hypothetical protein
MKLQAIALGLALAVAGSAFAATNETTVTRVTPHGTVTKHIVRSNDRQDMYNHRHHVNRVVVVHPQHRNMHRVVVVHPQHRATRKVVIVHPANHGRYAQNRTVVVHRSS